ncbi:MAG: hypothetical protein C4315_08135 [Chloroflexota bacterium]
MDVSRIGPDHVAFPPPDRPGAPQGRQGRKPEPVSPEAPISVSPEVRLIMALHQLVQNVSDVRPEVVAGLKAQVEAGSYQVDETELARLLLGGGRR